MVTDQQIEKVVSAFRSAFLPLKCVIEIHDHREKIDCRVVDAGNRPIITLKNESISWLNNDQVLKATINELRERLNRRGLLGH